MPIRTLVRSTCIITAVIGLVTCGVPLPKSGKPAPKGERIEHDNHVEYRNYPLNDILSECAKRAGYMHFHNPEIDGKEKYLVTGRINRNGEDLLQYDELCSMFGCTKFLKGNVLYAITDEQLAKMPRDKMLWKLRYIAASDVPETISKIQECFTAIDSKVEYLEDRGILRIQGRTDEVEKAEAVLDFLDAEPESGAQ